MTADRAEFGDFTRSSLDRFGTKGLKAREACEEVGKWATVPRASQWELFQVVNNKESV